MNIKTTEKRALSLRERAFITQAVREVLEDPDFGFNLTPRAKKRLESARRAHGKRISFAQIKERHS